MRKLYLLLVGFSPAYLVVAFQMAIGHLAHHPERSNKHHTTDDPASFRGKKWFNPKVPFSLQSTTVPSSTSRSETVPDDEESYKNGSKSEGNESSSSWTPSSTKHNKYYKERLSMPWSDVQDWALQDNLPKYTVMIPLNHQGSPESATNNQVYYALWRSMLKEVPELAGYPIDFLQHMHSKQIANSNNDNDNDNDKTMLLGPPGSLPYLDEYEFTSAGGISGKIYGVPGLADGFRIETSPVMNIEVTLPKGFARTFDGAAAYELGTPKGNEFSFSSTSKKLVSDDSSGSSYTWLQSVSKGARAVVPATSTDEADGLLVRLGATTGILLAGATAISMLSHHLTVNVFWV